jgi:DNA polymerase-1
MSGLTRFLMVEVELPLVEVVADLEEAGYLIDADHFRALRDRLEKERADLLARMRPLAGDLGFNPASAGQVRTLLFETLKLPVTRTTPTGKAATDEGALTALKGRHEVVPLLLRHQALSKVITTYCTLPDKVDADGRYRVEYNQVGAETGRFTSASLIQTVPKADEFAIRKGFVAAPGHTIVAADFGQQELCVLAAVSGDANLLEAIAAGTDLHGLAAVKVFKLDCAPNEVKEKHRAERERIKAIQFGLIYGRGPQSLAAELGLPLEEAKKLQEDYFEQFPAVRAFIDKVPARVQRDGFIDDLFGRRRHLPDAQLPRPRGRYDRRTAEDKAAVARINKALREAQNTVIQGASATLTKLAMLRCHRHIRAEHPGIRMLLTAHDELQFEVPDAEVGHFAAELPGLMCDLGLERFDFPVKMAVEVKAGPSWGELRPYTPREGDDRGPTAPNPKG